MEWLPLGTITGLFALVVSILWRRQNSLRDNAVAHIETDIASLFQYITDIKTTITEIKVDMATVQGDIKRLESWHEGKGET